MRQLSSLFLNAAVGPCMQPSVCVMPDSSSAQPLPPSYRQLHYRCGRDLWSSSYQVCLVSFPRSVGRPPLALALIFYIFLLWECHACWKCGDMFVVEVQG